jgi:glycine cleavage system transcriptional repressor
LNPNDAVGDLSQEYVITVTAKDRPGIIAAITRAMAALGGNVDELSQTVMRGYFTILLSARFPATITRDDLKDAVEREGANLGLSITVRDTANDDNGAAPSLEDRYVLTVQGDDRPGIIAQITTYLASQDINIEDFYARSEQNRFMMVLQIQVAGAWNADQLRLDLEAIGSEIGLRANLQHEDIFRATSEVGAVRRLVTYRRPLDR